MATSMYTPRSHDVAATESCALSLCGRPAAYCRPAEVDRASTLDRNRSPTAGAEPQGQIKLLSIHEYVFIEQATLRGRLRR